jgi:hypothetical protein
VDRIEIPGMRHDAPRTSRPGTASATWTRAAAIAFLVAAVPAGSSAAKDGSWLDAVPLAQWNAPGRTIPRPPASTWDPPTVARCAGERRKAASAAEKAVVRAGWSLVVPPVRGGPVEIVLGASGVDGMCRPEGYQLLAFSGGRFAGTLSPHPMDARTDGAVDLPTVDASGRVEAGFRRYAPADPLCCPSRTSTVTFRVEADAGGPVLRAGTVRTTRNDVDGGAPPATPPQAAPAGSAPGASGGACAPPPESAPGASWTPPAAAGCAPAAAESGCAASGGRVESASCCGSVGDFPDTCRVGACGCAPSGSHTVRVCRCPEGTCFDGAACVGRRAP